MQFFNSPNIHTCKWMPPIHSINSLWFCPLEVEFVISCPALTRPLHSIEKNQPQCRVCDGLTYNVKSKLFLVSMRGCNCIAKILKEKLNQWLLLLIISLLNLICCRTVAKLTSIMPMSSACYSLWIIVCCAVTFIVYCVRQAYGDWLEFFTIDLADPRISPTIPCPFANYELAYWHCMDDHVTAAFCLAGLADE